MTLPVVHTNAVYINKAVVVTFLKSSVVYKTNVSWDVGRLWNHSCCGYLSKMKDEVSSLSIRHREYLFQEHVTRYIKQIIQTFNKNIHCDWNLKHRKLVCIWFHSCCQWMGISWHQCHWICYVYANVKHECMKPNTVIPLWSDSWSADPQINWPSLSVLLKKKIGVICM